MRQVLSVSLPEGLTAALSRVTQEVHLTRSEVVRLALQDFFRSHELEALRRRLVPKARRKGIFTDEDVFRTLRS